VLVGVGEGVCVDVGVGEGLTVEVGVGLVILEPLEDPPPPDEHPNIDKNNERITETIAIAIVTCFGLIRKSPFT
jgi:hypothetical protein